MADDLLERGPDRSPSRRTPVLVVLLCLGLAALLVVRLTSGSGPAKDSRYPPWRGLPVGAPLAVDHAQGRVVVSGGQVWTLGTGVTVVRMVTSPRGPILLLRHGGSDELVRLVRGRTVLLDSFPGTGRTLSGGVAVDPTGSRVAYGITDGPGPGPRADQQGRLVLLDLRTGGETAWPTRGPVSVRAWTSDGVVVDFPFADTGSPVLWRPGDPAGRPLAGPSQSGAGSHLLAVSPVGREWALSEPGASCTVLVLRPGARPAGRFCPGLAPPTAYSPSGDHLVGLAEGGGVLVLDLATGLRTRAHVALGSRVAQLAWQDDDTFLLTSSWGGAAGRGPRETAVLRCTVAGACHRVPLADQRQLVVLPG